MLKYVAIYAAIAFVMVALDFVWLGYIAKSTYQEGIGHLMAAKPNIAVAVVFYLIYAAGVMLFAVLPNEAVPGWTKTVATGALFGFMAYATYDLSNLATLRDWPVSLAAIDIAWGTFISAVCAGVGKAVLHYWPAGT